MTLRGVHRLSCGSCCFESIQRMTSLNGPKLSCSKLMPVFPFWGKSCCTQNQAVGHPKTAAFWRNPQRRFGPKRVPCAFAKALRSDTSKSGRLKRAPAAGRQSDVEGGASHCRVPLLDCHKTDSNPGMHLPKGKTLASLPWGRIVTRKTQKSGVHFPRNKKPLIFSLPWVIQEWSPCPWIFWALKAAPPLPPQHWCCRFPRLPMSGGATPNGRSVMASTSIFWCLGGYPSSSLWTSKGVGPAYVYKETANFWGHCFEVIVSRPLAFLSASRLKCPPLHGENNSQSADSSLAVETPRLDH